MMCKQGVVGSSPIVSTTKPLVAMLPGAFLSSRLGPSIATVDVEVGGERTLMSRVAVIGDVGGYARHLRHGLGKLGVTDSVWPDDLHVIQVGDLFGGRADVEVAELVGPHLRCGRWAPPDGIMGRRSAIIAATVR